MFSTLSKTKIIISSSLILSSANALNLDQSEIFFFGKESTCSKQQTFSLFQTQAVTFTLFQMARSVFYWREKSPAQVAQWWACQTHDLVVVSLIPVWGDFSFRHIFTSHLCRSMWNKSGKLSQDTPVLPQVIKLGHAPDKIQVWKTTKGTNSKIKQARVIIPVHCTSPLWDLSTHEIS